MEHRLPAGRTVALALLAALLPYAWLVWRFDYLSDDAYINFAYARHLARGFGLRFNLDEQPPVEAYNALWTVVMAIPEWIGWNAPAASKVATVASGLLLLAYVLFFVRVRLGLSALATALVGLFLVTLPPFAMWSTSGMEAMPTVLFLFAAYERLLGSRERPHGWQAGLCAAIAGAMRPDGVPLAAVIVAAGIVAGFALHRRELVRAALACGLVLGVTFALHTGFRRAYHHAWVPNTVRVKGEMDALTLERGFDYFMTMMLAFPGLVVVLVLGLALTLKRPWIERTLPLAIVVASYLGYLIAVGADFMPMGRFLLNALPFLAVGWGSVLRVLESGRARAAAVPLTAVCIALSLPAAFDRHVVPESVRARFNFRWSQEEFMSEYQGWAVQRDNTTRWVREGRALARYTKRGESLIRGPIGAVGYHAELHLFDRFGLTDRDVLHREIVPGRMTAGHTRHVEPDYFLPQQPTYRFMRLQTWEEDAHLLLFVEPAALAVGLQTRVERHPLSGFPGFAADELLELHRLMPLDTDFDMVLSALEVVRDVDLTDATAAEAELTRRVAPVDVLGQRLAGRAQDLIASAPRQPGPSRAAERAEIARGWRAELWYHNGQATARKYKNGAVHLIVPIGGAPLVDGRAPGWTVVPPGGVHGPAVTGGVAAFLTLQPL